jgi:F0F1-type ATP synthase assembly protein I
MEQGKENKDSGFNEKENTQNTSGLEKFMGLGISLLALILIPALGGNWLDYHFQHTIPWLTILFSFVGIILSFFYVFKELRN